MFSNRDAGDMGSLDTFGVPTFRVIKKTGQIRQSSAHVLLPHEMWADMSRNKKHIFEKVFDADNETLRRWWASVRNEPWMQDHPLAHWIYDGNETNALP